MSLTSNSVEEMRISKEARFAKQRLLGLPYNIMIKIMFSGYLNTLNNQQIIELDKSIMRGDIIDK